MKTTIIALKVFLFFTLLTGIIYPLLITGIAQIIFPQQANGGLIIKNNEVVGSELIGQQFNADSYFWSRPSAIDYNPLPSGGSNLSLTSTKLKELINERSKNLKLKNHLDSLAILPSEMIFASASGLDPHISPAAAFMQIERIAKARNIKKEKIEQLIKNQIEMPQFLFLGEERVNVLLLNLKLDKLN